MPEMNMVDAINLALHQEMEKNKDIVVLGEDVGREGGVFRVTAGLQKKYGEERVIDTPLSEAGIVGSAIGMAVYGLRPVAEIQFDGFVHPAFDQLISHASRLRTRTRGRFTCPLVVRFPYGGGIRALEHHSDSFEALYVHTPGLKVVIPSTPYDAKGLLISALRDPDPVIFMEPKRIYRAIKQEVPTDEYTVPLGKADIRRSGSDVTLICYGALVREAEKAADALASERISCEILDLRTVSPMDRDAILTSVKKTGRCVVVHEAPRTAGLGAEISALIMEKVLLDLKAPVERVTGFDTVMPLYRLEAEYLPDSFRIIQGVKKVMSF
jgi:pyruvate dehydrogenase E1 component beta subunit